MATEHPATQFIGLDKVPLFPKCIRPANVSFVQHDATLGLPYEDNSFDLVHMRMFLMAFNKHQYADCMKEVFRITKPNGIVQLLEVEMVVRILQCNAVYVHHIITFTMLYLG